MREQIVQLIIVSLKETGEILDRSELSSPVPTMAIYGNKGCLDSLGLIRFIVVLEEKLAGQFGKSITLVSERAMSQSRSPFLDVPSLATYVEELLKGE